MAKHVTAKDPFESDLHCVHQAAHGGHCARQPLAKVQFKLKKYDRIIFLTGIIELW